MRRVIIESPYAGEVEENIKYVRACLRDCLLRGEAPFASHALYTLPGVLDDKSPAERKLGMRAGFTWIGVAELTAVYIDRGISTGMAQGILKACAEGREVEFRSLEEPLRLDGSTPLSVRERALDQLRGVSGPLRNKVITALNL